MAVPLNSSNQNQIQAVDNELEQYIKQAESGNPNAKKLSSIQQKLNALLQDPNIPESVKLTLQTAVNELKQAQAGGGNINNLYTAKTQVDAVLSASEGERGEADEQKTTGGSLSGGSEE